MFNKYYFRCLNKQCIVLFYKQHLGESGIDIESIKLELVEYGQTKKCAEVYFRHDWECYYFSVLGKCFGLMSNDIITLKGDPAVNKTLRQKHSDIMPGYYTNKEHWNSVKLNTKQLSLNDIKKLIDESYELVKSKLTKVQKEQIDKTN